MHKMYSGVQAIVGGFRAGPVCSNEFDGHCFHLSRYKGHDLPTRYRDVSTRTRDAPFVLQVTLASKGPVLSQPCILHVYVNRRAVYIHNRRSIC